MLNALDHVTAIRFFAGVFKVAESVLLASGSRSSLDQDFKKDTGHRIAFKLNFSAALVTVSKTANRHPFSASLGHFQVPHAGTIAGSCGAGKGRN